MAERSIYNPDFVRDVFDRCSGKYIAFSTWMSLGFTDNGKAVTDKGVKQGDKITAQCQIGGSDGNLMMLIECALK